MNNNIHRRTFLNQATVGIGSLALANQLLSDRASAAGNIRTHLPVKAKRVIFLCMAGGPSHLETLDHKPTLAEMDGKPMPASITAGQPIAQLQGKELKCLGPQLSFVKSRKVRTGNQRRVSARR